MSQESVLKVQICDLKVGIHCNGCVKEVKKILHKIDGVYQTSVDAQQGKVTVIGQMDMDTVFKKLKKAGKIAQLWDANPAMVSKHQNLQVGGTDRGDELKDVGGKGLPLGEANSSSGSGDTNDAAMVLPQQAPASQQDLPNLQQQIERRLQMLKGMKLPPHLHGDKMQFPVVASVKAPHAFNKAPEDIISDDSDDEDFEDDGLEGIPRNPRLMIPMGVPPSIRGGDELSGKKAGVCTEIPVPVNRNTNNSYEKDASTKMYLGAGGSQVKNTGIGQQLQNISLPGQANKDGSVGVGSGMAPQQGGMTRPTNNMMDLSNFPFMGQVDSMSTGPYTNMGGNNMKASGGGGGVHGLGMSADGLPWAGLSHSNAGSGRPSEPKVMQQVQQPYMMVQPQQEHQMMNGHGHHGQNGHYGPGGTEYPPMGYGCGHGHPQLQYHPSQMYHPMPQYPSQMYYPPMPPYPHDNSFSDENPNICSMM